MTSSPPAAPGSPATFADLGLPVVMVQALRRDGIESPFPIQAATAPDVLAGRDVLGRGPTGSGKTLAFGLPMLARITGAPAAPGRPHGLILVPTRELAAQIERALESAALAVGLRVASVVGGAPIKRQADRLARGVDLLIATPGRLEDLISQRAADLSRVRITALDEADHMADMGFLPQVVKLLDRTPADGQRLLFSATLDGEVDKLVNRYLRDPVTHSTAPPSAAVATMSHHLLFVRDKLDKRAVVTEIAARDGLTIMFVRTKHGADRLAKQLRGAGIEAGALHGGKAQNNRTRTLAAFADGSTPVLVTTDVAARGIHVDGISLVVHVDPPPEPKAYLHRAGRTARAGEDGVVVTIVMAEERSDVEKMTRKAGIDIDGVQVAPGSRALVEITGARKPPGGERVAQVAPTAAPAASGTGRADRPATRRGAPARRRGAATGSVAPARRDGTAGTRSNDSGESRGGRVRRSTNGRAEKSGESANRRGGERSAGGTRAPRTEGSRSESMPRRDSATARDTGARRDSPSRGDLATRGDTPGRSRRRAGRPQGSPVQGNRRAN